MIALVKLTSYKTQAELATHRTIVKVLRPKAKLILILSQIGPLIHPKQPVYRTSLSGSTLPASLSLFLLIREDDA